MKVEFDKAGFKFVIKFVAQFVFIYFSTSLLSSLFFNHLYINKTFALETGKDNVALVLGPEVSVTEEKPIALGFVGDIMLDRGVESVVMSRGGGDFNFVFEHVREELNNFDLLFGNLEGPVSDKGRDLGGLYSFRMNPNVIEGLSSAGFDVLSLANNHGGDWGEEALVDTIYRLSEAGISSVGAGSSREEAYTPASINVNGFRVLYLAFTESTGIYTGGNLAVATEDKIRESITLARDANNTDLIIASFHFGDEYQNEPNERQRKLSYVAIDSGADLVIGSHPHVTQSMEQYGDGFIFYSLGNFVFDQSFSNETMHGWLVKAFVWPDGSFSHIEICDVSINSLFQPVIDSCSPAFDFSE